MRIIDVSHHQGIINWEEVKPQIDGAIIRCGYGENIISQDDKHWRKNVDECTRLNIPFGVYIYSYAKTIESAKSEAQHVLRLIKGYDLSFPVYLDLEEKGTEDGAIERANVFGDIIEAAGYWCGVYANKYWWEKHLVGLERFTKWVARYAMVLGYAGKNVGMWQYSSTGKINGINGKVDMNIAYINYPTLINKTYIVKQGDTLTSIACKTNADIETICKLNKFINVGDVIRIK